MQYRKQNLSFAFDVQYAFVFQSVTCVDMSSANFRFKWCLAEGQADNIFECPTGTENNKDMEWTKQAI